MSRLSHCIVLATLVFGSSPSFAEDELRTPAVKNSDLVACFQDGTVVQKIALQEKNLEIMTKYGKLTVPVSDIRRIEFGSRLPDEIAGKIEESIRQLGAENYNQREAASQEVVALGVRAYPALEKAAKSPDKEVAKRAQAALGRIREKVPEEQLRTKEHDVMHTHDCILTGSILSPTIKARNEYFGDLQLKLADLRSLHSSGCETQVAVDAGKYDQWLDTGFLVEADQALVVNASGQVDLAPQTSPGQALSGPEGFKGGGNENGHPYGTLLGRIGENGEVFAIGKHFEGKIGQEGKLYLRISPVEQNKPSGSYKVHITTRPDFSMGPKAARAAHTRKLTEEEALMMEKLKLLQTEEALREAKPEPQPEPKPVIQPR